MPEDEKWEGLCYARKLERMEKQKKGGGIWRVWYGNIGGEKKWRPIDRANAIL